VANCVIAFSKWNLLIYSDQKFMSNPFLKPHGSSLIQNPPAWFLRYTPVWGAPTNLQQCCCCCK